jgi:hypothetical protein
MFAGSVQLPKSRRLNNRAEMMDRGYAGNVFRLLLSRSPSGGHRPTQPECRIGHAGSGKPDSSCELFVHLQLRALSSAGSQYVRGRAGAREEATEATAWSAGDLMPSPIASAAAVVGSSRRSQADYFALVGAF